ncbi:MAG: hypothetical protein ACXQTL_02830 [Methanosarcinales archaeon]
MLQRSQEGLAPISRGLSDLVKIMFTESAFDLCHLFMIGHMEAALADAVVNITTD